MVCHIICDNEIDAIGISEYILSVALSENVLLLD